LTGFDWTTPGGFSQWVPRIPLSARSRPGPIPPSRFDLLDALEVRLLENAKSLPNQL
jgi:hypothetical protein